MYFQGITPFEVTDARMAPFGKETLQSDLNSSSLLKTEQKHLPWWLSLIWQNINLDHLPKNAPVTKVTSFLLPGPMPSTGDAGGCPFLTLPNQPLSRCCMVQYPFPDALPSPVLELFWDYMPGQGRRIHLISKHKSAMPMVSVQGTQRQWLVINRKEGILCTVEAEEAQQASSLYLRKSSRTPLSLSVF